MTNKVQHHSWIPRIRLQPVTTALAVGALLLSVVPAAWSQEEKTPKPPAYNVLYTFTGGADGAVPEGGLLLDLEGKLYGTTASGGDLASPQPPCGGSGCGVVFKLDRAEKEAALHTFTGYPTDGQTPYAGLLADEEGNFYGTTRYGGTYGVGTVFRVDRAGNETVLHSFTGGTDGANPFAGLIRDKEGNLYGTTLYGGDLSCTLEGPYGCGVVFRIDMAGQETVLHSFTGGADGAFPTAGLIRDQKGNLYGTTEVGGLASCSFYCGVVFQLDRAGKETVLHSFTGGADGANPQAGLIRDEEGNLYGTASYGGDLAISQPSCAPFGCGVVFKLATTGRETVLYSFTGGADGAFPSAALARGEGGNLYGTTSFGGDIAALNTQCGGIGCGVLFKVNATGKETVLYTFTGGRDGAIPEAGLLLDLEGKLYGTTAYGGGLATFRRKIEASDQRQ